MIDKNLIDNFDKYLDSYYGKIDIDGKTYDASEILKKIKTLYEDLYEEYISTYNIQ
jgi:hypothetical protein